MSIRIILFVAVLVWIMYGYIQSTTVNIWLYHQDKIKIAGVAMLLVLIVCAPSLDSVVSRNTGFRNAMQRILLNETYDSHYSTFQGNNHIDPRMMYKIHYGADLVSGTASASTPPPNT